jgi:hypothetical protein
MGAICGAPAADPPQSRTALVDPDLTFEISIESFERSAAWLRNGYER